MREREIDQIALEAANDDELLSEFIKQRELFILKTASKTAKRFLSKDDDEWSIALMAFSDAVKKYDYARGSFISFAELMIHRKLVDYYRSQGKYGAEIQVEYIESEAIVEYNDGNLKLEIEEITQVLESYDFTFMELADCSPKARKTKKTCSKAINCLLNDKELLEEMQTSKQLPLKKIVENISLPRKILERHRKYIIAVVEILYGDYPYLSEYVNFVREEEIK